MAHVRHSGKVQRSSGPNKPIDLYYWPTPNGWKISIMLEECRLAYNVIPVNIARGDQFKPAFDENLSEQSHAGDRRPRQAGQPADFGVRVQTHPAISRTQDWKILSRWRTGARTSVDEWLFLADGKPRAEGRQTIISAATHRKELPYALDRFGNEMHRLYRVMNLRLKDHRFLMRRLFDRRHGVRRLDQAVRAAIKKRRAARRSRSFRISNAGSKRFAPGRPFSAACTHPRRGGEQGGCVGSEDCALSCLVSARNERLQFRELIAARPGLGLADAGHAAFEVGLGRTPPPAVAAVGLAIFSVVNLARPLVGAIGLHRQDHSGSP